MTTVTPALDVPEGPLWYSDPTGTAVVRRKLRKRPWNAEHERFPVRIARGHVISLTGAQITLLLEHVAKVCPWMRPRNVLKSLTETEVRSIFPKGSL